MMHKKYMHTTVLRCVQFSADFLAEISGLWPPAVPASVPQASFMVTPTVIGGRSSLSVQWRPPSSDLPVLEYTVIVKVSSLVGGKGRKETTNSTSLTVENLTIGTTYTISVKAKSAVGFGAKLRRMVNTLDGEELVCCVWHLQTETSIPVLPK